MTSYRDSIFTPPGRTGILSRLFFYAYNLGLKRMLGADEFAALARSLILLAGLISLIVFLVMVSPLDPLMVLFDKGYGEPSVIFARGENGQPVAVAEFYRLDRKVLSLESDASRQLKVVQALVATEDNNFYSHFGLDVQGILRAVVVNIIAGEIKEGASTITQQVARLRFLSSERSFARKAREAFLAVLIELRHPKNKIMELYLNEVPLGHGTLGAEAASRFYFNKSVADLEWGEAAIIASLTTRPADFSPLRDIRESRKKVRTVFRRLVETGVLSTGQAEEEYRRLEEDYYAGLNRSPNDSAFNARLNLHPYVTEYVKTQIPASLVARLYTGGLRIYTTIEETHQSAAEDVFIPHLKELTKARKRPPFRDFDAFDDDYGDIYPLIRSLPIFDLPEFKTKISRDEKRFQRAFSSEIRGELSVLNLLAGEENVAAAIENHFSVGESQVEDDIPVEGSLISMRPRTGAITAVVGGSGFTSSNQQLRFSTARRQPGSAFKPLIFAAGIDYTASHPGTDRSLTAATVIDDTPKQFIAPDLSEYSPENYSDSYDGPIRLRRALTYSKNTVAVGVYELLGPDRLTEGTEHLLQLDQARPPRNLPREASVALGTFEVTPMELTRAYAVFASEGREVHPYLIEKITDAGGRVLYDASARKPKEPRQVVRPETAALMTSMLRDVILKGTGTGAHVGGHDAVGKTGTTNRYSDAWFVGYTPELVAGVQIGYDFFRGLGRGATGGGLAAPAWGRFMTKALSHEPAGRFPSAGLVGVEICELSGRLPGDRCKETVVEYFVPGTAPTQKCDEHKRKSGVDADPDHRPEKVFGDDF